MLRILLYSSLMSLFMHQTNTLNYIGYCSSDIKENMSKTDSDFFFKKEFDIKKAKIIKYTDIIESKTLLYILDTNDFCRYYMIMYDKSYYNEVINSLNQNYRAEDKDIWIESCDGHKFKKYIEKTDFYFTVVTKKMN